MSNFVFLNLAPTGTSSSTAARPVVRHNPHNPFLNLSPTVSSPFTSATSASTSVTSSPTSSRNNSIDFLSLAPVSSPLMTATIPMGMTRERRSSSIKSDGSVRFLRLN